MGAGSPRGVGLYIVTGVPPGESARARAGTRAQTLRHRVRSQPGLVFAGRRLAEAYAAELAARGLVVTWRRWRPRGALP